LAFDIKITIEKCNDDINTEIDFNEADKFIKDAEAINKSMEKTKEKYEELKELKKQIKSYSKFIIENNAFIKKEEKRLFENLPEICPWCNKPLDKDHFIKEIV